MNESDKALMATIPASQGSLVLVHPGEQALDFPSAVVAPECSAVLRNGRNTASAVWGDQFDSLGWRFLIEWVAVVGTIHHNSSGSLHGDRLSERRFDKGDFMWRRGSCVHDAWKTRSVNNNHELITLVPLGLSSFDIPFFATVKVPSMKHSVRSIPPCSSRSRTSASSIFLSTPAFIQRQSYLKQVDGERNRSGRSAYEVPVRNTLRTSSITARLSLIPAGRVRQHQPATAESAEKGRHLLVCHSFVSAHVAEVKILSSS